MAEAEVQDVITRTILITWRVLYILSYPFFKLFRLVATILSPLWTATQFLLLPFTVIAQTLLSIVLFPFRLNLLERIETLYIYLGIAALIGFLAGGILYIAFNFLASTLRIDASSVHSDAVTQAKMRKARSTAEYRADRSRRKEIAAPSSPNTLRGEMAVRRQRGLLAQTIIEEEDSDF